MSLGDLGHFACRSKALESRRENFEGVSGAGGRLVKLGERQRGAQTPTACALLFCDGDGVPEGFLRTDEVAGVAFEQDFAAQEMREWEIAMFFSAPREGQRLVDARESAASPERLGLELREPRNYGPMVP